MMFAEISAGEWLAIAGAIGTGLGTGGTALGLAIRFAFTKYADIRREERKHEQAIAQRFTESAERVQKDAADDNRKALEDSRAAFTTLIEIQRDAMKAVASLVNSVEKLDGAVNELRAEVTGKKTEKRRRTRPLESEGADSGQGTG